MGPACQMVNQMSFGVIRGRAVGYELALHILQKMRDGRLRLPLRHPKMVSTASE